MPAIDEVEVYGWIIASGIALGGALVLTAGHVVSREDAAPESIQVRSRKGTLLPCTVIWRPASPELDVALLEVVNGEWSDPDRDAPMRWGRVARTRSRLTCDVVGFPRVTATPQMRDSEQLSGFINLRSLAKSDMYAITLDQTAMAPDDGISPWAGMSGAGVWHRDALIAMVVTHPSRYGTNRLVAVPVSSFAEDSDFVQVLTERAVHVELETVSDSPGVNRPTLKSATGEELDEDLVFVICSFRDDMEPAFEAIAAAAEAVGLRAARVKDEIGDFRITERMLSMIRRARIIVADLTHERPNVYFELGYARALEKTVITILHKGAERHFDVYDWTYLEYADSRPLERMLIDKLKQEISGAATGNS